MGLLLPEENFEKPSKFSKRTLKEQNPVVSDSADSAKLDYSKFTETKIYSVDEISTHIKDLLTKNKVLQDVSIKGEISNFRHYNGKHMYFDLKDEQSIIRCCMFQRSNESLEFNPENGAEVIVKGNIDVYKERGSYQIIVESMELAGKGALHIKFLQLKEKLEKEGLFREEFKKPIPKMPRKIGVVTSLQGAAIKDIIKTIKRRFSHVEIIIYPSLVQGSEAKYSIEKGIQILNDFKVDVIIVSRGGGSIEDLWAFNEENVARAIFRSKIPIISGVGHETDFTIADFVADKRAHTPSAAAEMVVPDEQEIIHILLSLEKRLNRDLIAIKDNYRQRLSYIKEMPVFRKPFVLIVQYAQMLDDKEIQFVRIFSDKNESMKRNILSLKEKLNALNPETILGRGYSITMKGSKIIKSTKDIKKEEVILTTLRDGKIRSRIE